MSEQILPSVAVRINEVLLCVTNESCQYNTVTQ